MTSSGHMACNLEFVYSRILIRAMHYALHAVKLQTVFPQVTAIIQEQATPELQRCISELIHLRLYESQQQAVRSMLEPAYRQVGYY